MNSEYTFITTLTIDSSQSFDEEIRLEDRRLNNGALTYKRIKQNNYIERIIMELLRELHFAAYIYR